MKVFHGIENYSYSTKSILTIGTFDGIHIGHQKIIRTLVSHAREKNLQANLLTFFPHPRMILQKETSIKLIDTQKEKERILESLGIDNLIVHPFSKDFSRLTATEFTRDILVDQLGISSYISVTITVSEKIEKLLLKILLNLVECMISKLSLFLLKMFLQLQ